MKKSIITTTTLILFLAGCGIPDGNPGGGTDWVPNTDQPALRTRLIFIHHSCGQYWLADGNGNLGETLLANNYYVSDTNYGWPAGTWVNPANGNLEAYDLGSHTDTSDWPLWFNDEKMPYVYASSAHTDDCYDPDSVTEPSGENKIIMFKSCYPLSEVGESIEDEQAIYTSLLSYFRDHTDKLFVLITPPGETEVSSYILTRQLCTWLCDTENGWLADYPHKNVFVYDFYCTLSETDSHHRVVNGRIEHVYAANYDGISPYHDGDDHPTATGNRKATDEFVPLLNAAYNRWKGIE